MDDDNFDPWGPGKRGMLVGTLIFGPLVLIIWWFFG